MQKDKPESTPRTGVSVPEGTTRRPTLKTIAYMTGLGVTTVSRALNDAPDISAATKERVRLVARQIGYRPNRAGVRLRTGKTNVISLITHTENEVLGLSTHLVYGISEFLAGTPYHLIVTPFNMNEDPLSPVRYIVETGSADGVILSRIEPNDARVTYLLESRMPFATHGRTDMDITHPYVDFDNTGYAAMAVDQLAARGRERLALLAPPPHLTYAKHMQDGLIAGVMAHDLMEVPLHGITTDSSHDEITAVIGRLMRSRARPDGIVCGSASSAIATITAAEEAGLTLGREFDVAVKETFNLMKKFRRDVIVVHEDFRDTGQRLGAALLSAINGEDPAQLQTLIAPKL